MLNDLLDNGRVAHENMFSIQHNQAISTIAIAYLLTASLVMEHIAKQIKCHLKDRWQNEPAQLPYALWFWQNLLIEFEYEKTEEQ